MSNTSIVKILKQKSYPLVTSKTNSTLRHSIVKQKVKINRSMKLYRIIFALLSVFSLSSYTDHDTEETFSLTVTVADLQNSKGIVQFSLYNTEGSIPDEHFEKYYLQLKAPISENVSTVTFKNIPKGTYAINILHDEDEDGKVTKGFILPIEGLGFSNFTSLNLLNRPSYKKAKFNLESDKTMKIKVIYM